jgi:hypothetical protein
MLVLLPFYDRISILPFVLENLFQAELNINERINVLIVNNNPKLKNEVNSCVDRCSLKKISSVQVIHRKYTMEALDSWFDAIFNFSSEDEIVAMMGDDDFSTKDGLRARLELISSSKSDMLICNFHDRIYIYKDEGKFWYSGRINFRNIIKAPRLSANSFRFKGSSGVEPSFISNHTYKNSNKLWDGYNLAKSWAREHELLGLTPMISSGPVPMYLAFSIPVVGGVVSESLSVPVIRGGIVEDIVFRNYAGGGNTALFSLLSLDTLVNKLQHIDLVTYNLLYERFCSSIVKGILELLFSKDISLKTTFLLLKRSKFNYSSSLLSKDLFYNALIIKRLFKFTAGLRLKLVSAKISQSNLINYLNEFPTDVNRFH